jgi:hypothetical protein
LDSLFEAIGVKKKDPPLIKIEAYLNKPLNRYAEHQIRRLREAKADPELY